MTRSQTDLAALQCRLGHHFEDPTLLLLALTHASAAQKAGKNNERLEFLGDRVLALVLAEHLLDRFPREREGAIAKRHAQLVRREMLAKVARDIDLGTFIIADSGIDGVRTRDQERVLADTMEAVIAAVYLDGGLDVARAFLTTRWEPLLEADHAPPRDPKSSLQEWAQGRGLPLPRYELLSCDGPPHDPDFLVSVAVDGLPAGTARGKTRRQAEQKAASSVLAAAGEGR